MTPWVLLRGLTRETGHWGSFPAQLAARFPGVPVCAVDLPGNGEFHAVRSPTRVEAMAEACRFALRAQGIKPPYRVVAMSLGAMVTVEWARRHPSELKAAVLMSTSLRPWSPLHHRLRPGAWPGLLRAAFARDPLQQERAVWHLTSQRTDEGRDAVLAQWAQLRRNHPVTTANALRQLWAAARYRTEATAPAVPLLLLAGAGDRLVHPACSAALARSWTLPLHVHDTAGHDLPLDDGPWVADRIAAWQAERAAPR